MPLPKKNTKKSPKSAKSPRGKTTKDLQNPKRKLDTSPGTEEVEQPPRRPRTVTNRVPTKPKLEDMADQKMMSNLDKKLDKICEEQELSRKLATEALSINTQTLEKVTSLQNEVALANQKIEIHSQEISKLTTSSAFVNTEIHSLKARVNYLEQKSYDNDLAITGFKKIPTELELAKICNLLHFERNKIIYAQSYQLRPRDNEISNYKVWSADPIYTPG